ncbi:MAG: HSP20 family protein [Myxococcota bacterium]|jgi:HSP20 family protein
MYSHFNGIDLRLAGFNQARRQMDSVFNGFGWPRPSTTVAHSQAFSETDDAYVLRALLPGAGGDDIDITVSGRDVTLKGQRKVSTPEGFEPQQRERQPIEFERTYRMPGPIGAEVRARLHNGILTVTVPKAAAIEPRKVDVELN